MTNQQSKGKVVVTNQLAKAKRVVIKIGSSLLVDQPEGNLKIDWLKGLAEEIVRLQKRDQEIVIVSSGAIALGGKSLGLSLTRMRLEDSQAAAAVGQIQLAHAYQGALAKYNVGVAQILLTLQDTEDRRQYLNARNTINTLLKLGVVPIINENDTVATTEIRYGDNDRLAARVAQMISADCLVLLSDVDGLFTSDPEVNSDARLIKRVDAITPEIEVMAGSPKTTGYGTGGMITKVEAAKTALAAGCHMVIINGSKSNPLEDFETSGRGTWFTPDANPKAARKLWIAGLLKPAGTLTIDKGAEAALLTGKSLLPVGVTESDGSFGRGDAVIVKNITGVEIARGLVAYSDVDTKQILGHKSSEIEKILGFCGRQELIHRDDLVLLENTVKRQK